ncbi:MAG: Integrase catalytic region [Sphaerisporangium sp.]|nr:Integrase catalytic region [Sphaerisporangium sp.]
MPSFASSLGCELGFCLRLREPVWEPCEVLLSLAYMIVRRVLELIVVLVRTEISKDAELLVLRHENAVLRRHITRPRYEPADRLWFSALSRLIPRAGWAGVFSVTPTTLLRWHRCWLPENGPCAVPELVQGG